MMHVDQGTCFVSSAVAFGTTYFIWCSCNVADIHIIDNIIGIIITIVD